MLDRRLRSYSADRSRPPTVERLRGPGVGTRRNVEQPPNTDTADKPFHYPNSADTDAWRKSPPATRHPLFSPNFPVAFIVLAGSVLQREGAAARKNRPQSIAAGRATLERS